MLTITLDDSDFRRTLSTMLGRLTDASPLMAGIAAELLSITDKAFAEQGPDWADLADSTKAKRTKDDTWPGMILNQGRGGGLLPSLQPDHSATEASLSSAKPYAAIHQFGGQAGKNLATTIKARPYMPIDGSPDSATLNKDTQIDIIEMARLYLDGENP